MAKRGPGRPPGSKNKRKRVAEEEETAASQPPLSPLKPFPPKRHGPGRPSGSRNKRKKSNDDQDPSTTNTISAAAVIVSLTAAAIEVACVTAESAAAKDPVSGVVE